MASRRDSFQYLGIEAVVAGVVECVNDVADADALIALATTTIYEGVRLGFGKGTDGSFDAMKDKLITDAGGNPRLYRP